MSHISQVLQGLLEDPPEYNTQAAAAELQARGVSVPQALGATPLQLGPLPMSLVEEMMRHS